MRASLGIVLLLAVSTLAECEPERSPVAPKGSRYLDPTSPENLLRNLETAYRERDLQGYLALLAPEFRFLFQPPDVLDLGLESGTWHFSQDSTGTAHLLQNNQVSAIRLSLVFGSPVPADTTEFPPGTLRILVDQVDLQVDQTDGITWIVDNQQDFYFRSGLIANGEDPARWFILEWRELELGGAALRPPTEGTAVDRPTWGKTKAQFR